MSLRRDGTAWRRTPPQDLVDRLLARERSAPRAHRGRAAPAGSAEAKAEEGATRPGRRPGRGDDLRRAGQGRRLHGGGPPSAPYRTVQVAAYVPPAGSRRAGGPDGQRPRSSTAGRREDFDLACDMKRYD